MTVENMGLRTIGGILLATIVLWMAPPDADAQSLRCKNDLASVGDNKGTVVARCGEPATKDSYCKPAASAPAPGVPAQPSDSAVCEMVDEWTYGPGPGQLITSLKFESGRLRSIEYGGRIP